jgi:hypothetical protein
VVGCKLAVVVAEWVVVADECGREVVVLVWVAVAVAVVVVAVEVAAVVVVVVFDA